MILSPKNIFLADDDADDRMLFEDVLKEVATKTKLTTVKDGQLLMDVLYQTVPPPPDVIFLDLNMPRKNGFECLEEIKGNNKLKDIPVVIFSTSMQEEAIHRVYEHGASLYVCKPGTFFLLKKVINKVLAVNWNEQLTKPSLDKFVLQP